MRMGLPLFWFVSCIAAAGAAEPIELKYSRGELEARWRARVQSLLDQGKLPKIDMETSIKAEQIADSIPGAFAAMDELGVALLAADGYQHPKDGSRGYRWSYYIRELVNRYPDRFIPTANGGTNPSWLAEKDGKQHYIAQIENHVRAGVYAHMGELDFRHYMSSSQCRDGRRDRDNDIPMNSGNGHRIFQLSAQTGVPFAAHLEPEDAALDHLQEMLAAYPRAKLIVAHFGQLRHPEKQKRFTPDFVRGLLSRYRNLSYDLSTGHPNRRYRCSGASNQTTLIGDTALWQGGEGSQTDTLKGAWRSILSDFSERFVFATDYGGGRPPLGRFLRGKVANFDRIIRGLPEPAKHNIAYKNAWKLLTGKAWDGAEAK